MKCRPALIVCCLATTIISYSCNKAALDQAPVQPAPLPAGKKIVSVVLGGELKTSESTLPGGRQLHNYVLAKTLRDSTIYAIDVRTPDLTPYASGIFNNPDNIKIELPTDSSFIITAAAFKRGTGFGLYYTLADGYGQIFDKPLYRSLQNKMRPATNVNFLADLTRTALFGEDTVSITSAFFPEMDTYIGTANVKADTSQLLTLPLKRAVFGIRFNAINFTDGKLIVAYENSMRTQTFTPEDISSSLRIYTADDFRRGDLVTSWERILFVLKWQRADGTVITLGEKELLPPARNHMVTVNVTLPTTINTVNNGLNITLTDTDWTSSETINL
ncbi:hypothetical protein [Chitinophaga ginsengisoli]|uniref:Fimbrillin-A associated anchor protein Mfa1/Mfa2 n=1 Tax=Chitinophaga ginsengisoli TaxID=363837 RepID=A0A2P8FVS6_9BACT|nr:hypothetical protein [Chitinophaga ginsengisoli]PSL25821.1 hypothetical protein CLV42_11226 [Chitinophaga ginsengisoli]